MTPELLNDRYRALNEAVQLATTRVGVRRFSEIIDRATSSVANCANPNLHSQQYLANHLFSLVEESKCGALVQQIAALAGYVAVPVSVGGLLHADGPQQLANKVLAQFMTETSRAGMTLAGVFEDWKVEHRELLELDAALDQLQTMINVIRSTAHREAV
ncbi:hypothetical protein [Iodobacter fluviatilis]|uniref:Uncharacterized protein n=1 Tax=Iodobacter fluviatilis TaxID=537 RepID=A0A377QAX1_9NEIS|nr:hypothetical protein [Iodobacter fluviatilis]TCU81233.1 hypothetical protein EV682_12536 [Iodobacter fluviatilis]STQ91749.1 Uncharacterised protein [Iodobacter fluviatilis]